MKKQIEFQDLVVTRKNVRVTWEDIGEGLSGDYDNTDSDDVPLLRFSCDRKVDGDWEQIDDGSYCTRCPTNTPRKSLRRFAKEILDACEQPSPKRRLEELSWLCPEDAKSSVKERIFNT